MEKLAAANEENGDNDAQVSLIDDDFGKYVEDVINTLQKKKATLEAYVDENGNSLLNRPEGNPYGENASEEAKAAYAEYNKLRFYRINQKALDNEVREITNDPDLLMHLRGGNQDFRATMEFLTLSSLLLSGLYMWAYQSEFDIVLMKDIIASQDLNINKNYCIYTMPESKYLPSLWVMIAWQVFFIFLSWVLPLSK